MSLDLEVAGEARPLTDADIAVPAKPRLIARLRDSHHALARALATGLTPTQASIQTGYSASSISRLLGDPAFCDLIDHYHRTNEEAIVNVQERALLAGMDGMQELHERVRENPDSFTNDELLEYTMKHLAVAGHGPVSRAININKSVGIAERLDQFNRRRKDEAA